MVAMAFSLTAQQVTKPKKLFRITKGHLFGFIDHSGRIVVNPLYEDARSEFSEGLVAVAVNKKWGYIDTTGKMTIPPQFNIAYEFSEGLAPVKIGTGCELCGKWGFIDKTGKVVIEPRFEAVNDFSEGLAVFRQGTKSGFIDRTGRIVIEPRFDYATSFEAGLAEVQLNCNAVAVCDVGYIDKSGKYVWKPTQ
jgi:hypothetical protein